jgi:acetyl esterase/lipase
LGVRLAHLSGHAKACQAGWKELRRAALHWQPAGSHGRVRPTHSPQEDRWLTSRVAALARLIPLALVLASASPALAADPPADVDFARDVVYGTGGGEDLKLNIARPKGGAKNLPCIVFIHGGGWSGGDRAVHDDATWNMARAGYVSATVGYRLAPKHRFPAQVHDVKAAIRYLRAHADKHGLDPDRIGVCGFSAGAHLSMMLGTTDKDDGLEGDGGWADQSSAVQAVVAFFGPTDLAAADLPAITKPIVSGFIGGPLEEKGEEYRRAWPITYVDDGDAPTLIIQGTKDPLVPHSQAYAMIDALTEAGVPGRAEILVGAGHGWAGDSAEFKHTITSMLAFLTDQLRPKAAAAGAK